MQTLSGIYSILKTDYSQVGGTGRRERGGGGMIAACQSWSKGDKLKGLYLFSNKRGVLPEQGGTCE